MTIFAISDVVWQAIIAAILAIILLWMNQRNARKVAEVKTTLETTTDVTVQKLDIVGDNVLKIEKATNSMKDALVKAAGEAGELKGMQDERARVREAPGK